MLSEIVIPFTRSDFSVIGRLISAWDGWADVTSFDSDLGATQNKHVIHRNHWEALNYKA